MRIRMHGAVTALAGLALALGQANAQQMEQVRLQGPQVTDALQFDVSPPLSMLVAQSGRVTAVNVRAPLRRGALRPGLATGPDTLAQLLPSAQAVPLAMPAFSQNFLGLGTGFPGFVMTGAPPDTNLAVGPTRMIQQVNSEIGIFDKTGTSLLRTPTNTVFAGMGGGCQTNNDGDGIVQYDRLADRWLITQFSVSSLPYLQCVAVSTSSDPLGTYFRYAFSYGNVDFPDYPKIGVWPDGYYTTYNIFANGNNFTAGRACAFDRAAMLAGTAATQICFDTAIDSLMPSDLDGATPPPAGTPNFLVSLAWYDFPHSSLQYWAFHVDWATPANSTLTSQTQIAVAPYTSGVLVPQLGGEDLDGLDDRLMYRLAYRNFGTHESLVVNHSVIAGTGMGVRWYELRRSGANTLALFQQGTHAPDTSYRWMGSTAMDQQGNMALGFSTSSAAMHPAITVTGRLAGDTAGTMPQGEATVIAGAGSQINTFNRWGDYSAMRIDPTDDCTFWYTTEYIPATGSFNWATQIASFKFATCGVSGSSTALASSANPALLASAITLTASVTGTAPTGSVAFLNGVATIGGCGAQPLSGSGNTLTATCVTSSLPVGASNLTAVYAGDLQNLTSTSPVLVQNVVQAPGGALSCTPNPAQELANVACTVTITGNAPTGWVTFTNNGFNIAGCLGVALAGVGNTKSATCNTTALAIGSHAIVGNYTGDRNGNAPGASNTVTQVINPRPATTTIVASSANPSNYGQLVTFTATVTGAAPTGTVTFKDGASNIAGCIALPMAAASAACSTNLLTTGPHNVTGVYSGNVNNAPSTSAVVPQVVNCASPGRCL